MGDAWLDTGHYGGIFVQSRKRWPDGIQHLGQKREICYRETLLFGE